MLSLAGLMRWKAARQPESRKASTPLMNLVPKLLDSWTRDSQKDIASRMVMIANCARLFEMAVVEEES